jgi:lysophosphatidate acyltransferase
MSEVLSSFLQSIAMITKTLSYAAAGALAFLALASPRSQRARMYLNIVLYVSSLGICSFIGLVTSIVMNFIPSQRLNNNFLVARCFYLIAGSLTGVRFTVEGEENFEKARPSVLVGNHQSSMDILYLGRIFPKVASIMAKQELKYAPLLGQWMYLSGAVFIDRKNRGDAVKTFDQVGAAMKKDKLSLWVFPEGTRSKLPVPDLLPFKKGAFHLALQAQVPVVPVVCENYHRLFDSKSRFESGTIRIRVLPPVETKGMTAADATALTEKVRKQMLDALIQMDAEREDFDVSATADQPSSSVVGSSAGRPSGASLTVGSNIARGERGLGGLAGLIGKIVGTGSGRNTDKKAARDSERLKTKGSSGQRPEDYHLVSEAQRRTAGDEATQQDQEVSEARATGTQEIQAREGLTQRNAGASGSGDGNGSVESDETEGSTVLVEAPQ